MRVAVAGASGRMGRAIVEALTDDGDREGCVLHSALDRPESPSLGRDAAAFAGRESGIRVTSDLRAALRGADVLIDFTRPEGSIAHLAACCAEGVKMVVGTTGFSAGEAATIAAAAGHLAIVMSPNMSVGVNVLFRLAETAAGLLGERCDVEIVEAHHRHKVDAPSGTALEIGRRIAAARGRDFASSAVLARQGRDGERCSGEIGFSSIRGGDIVGDHTVLFAGDGERIELIHRSTSRTGYARGSLLAARFLASRQSGLFDMADVLGIG